MNLVFYYHICSITFCIAIIFRYLMFRYIISPLTIAVLVIKKKGKKKSKTQLSSKLQIIALLKTENKMQPCYMAVPAINTGL